MRVQRIEVKKCFVVSEEGKERLRNKEGCAFQEELDKLVKEVQGRSEKELNQSITWPQRLDKYDELTWYFEECSIDDVGVWYPAGGLPETWCIGSVRETAQCICENPKEIARISKQGNDKRAINNLPAIVKVANTILTSRYLTPIVVPGGTWRPTPPCTRMKGDIDDGSMRAIAFAIKGYEKFKAYVGKPT